MVELDLVIGKGWVLMMDCISVQVGLLSQRASWVIVRELSIYFDQSCHYCHDKSKSERINNIWADHMALQK